MAAVIYRYRPGARWGTRYPSNPRGTFFDGNIMVYEMNTQGFRDADFTQTKTPGRVRVAIIGDSFTLGEGVRLENIYPSALERLLQHDHPDAEVYNFGVNGYCTEDELVILWDTVMAYQPDLVVLSYVMNDAAHKASDEFFQTVLAEKNRWQPYLESHSRLISFVANRLWNKRLSSMTIRFVNSTYQNPVIWEYNKRLLLAIRDTVSQGGARLFVVIFPDFTALTAKNYPYNDIHRQLGDFFAQAGILYLDMKEIYSRNHPESLFVHPVDAHPNEEAHRLVAEALLKEISDQRLLP